MWFDQSVPVLAVADTTRPILLIAFIVGLFALAALGVFLGRKHVAAQNARALSDDTGLAKGAVKGGDGTFSSDWLAEAREDVDDTPRQSWADVLTLQGVGEVTETGPSPFGATAATEDPALAFGAPAPHAAPAYEAPTYPVEVTSPEPAAAPVFETPTYETPTYETPAYDEPEAPVTPTEPVYAAPAAPTYETPAFAEPAFAEPAYTEPAYTEPAYTEPAYAEPVTAVAAEPAVPVYEAPQPAPVYEAAPEAPPVPPAAPAAPAAPAVPATPGEEYATFFGATPPPPPPPPVEPFNIWAPETDDR